MSQLNIKGIKRIFGGVLVALLIALLVAVPVLAAYYAYIDVTESNGTSYTELAMNYSINVTYLVDAGYITSTGMDTRVTDSGYLVLPHMLADDRLMWVGNITGSTTTRFIFFTGQEAMNSFSTITGHGGYVTVVDNATLEPGDEFAFGVVGYVDTSAGTNKNIIRKDNALVFNVTAEEELTFAITGGNSIVASNVSSGYMTIMVFSDGFDLWMEIDEIQVGANATASSVPNTATNWTLFENDVCPYVSYYGEWVVP